MSGRVIRFRKSAGRLAGLVLGSQPHPYEVMVWLNAEGVEDSECSCPVGSACKHVAAVALRETLGHTLKGAAPKAAAKLTESPRLTAAWARATKNWIPEPLAAVPGRLRLMMRIGSDDVDWQANAASRRQLQIRPVIHYPAANRISLSDISWKSYLGQSPYRAMRSLLDEDQNWFLFQLAKALTIRDSFYAWNDQWLSVDHQNARFVWDVLSRAGAAGVQLYSGEKDGPIISIDMAVTFKAKTVLEDIQDSVSVQNSLRLGDGPAGETVLFGSPVIFGALLKPETTGYLANLRIQILSLHAAEPFMPESVTAAPPVLIPGSDIDQFTEKFLPKLPRSVTIENRSKRITLPIQMPPRARVEVAPFKANGISVVMGWKYGSAQMPLNSRDTSLVDGTGQRIARDAAAEEKILEALRNYFEPFGPPYREPIGLLLEGKRVTMTDGVAAGFLIGVLPRLNTLTDVEVAVDPATPALIGAIEPKAELTLREEPAKGDWFDLGICILIEGESIGFEKCFEAISRKEKYLFLPSGRFVSLDHPFFEKLRELIRQASHLKDAATGNIRLTRFQAGWWEELAQFGVIREQADRWRESVDALIHFKEIPVLPQPPEFKGTLRHYQAEGYSWMNFLREHNMGGVLADDMGLGKTVQTICLAARGRTPFLIIAPTSVVENWDMELERFAPHLKRTVMRSGDRTQAHEAMKDSDIVVTSYALLQRDQAQFMEVAWDTVIFDEAQFVKNHQSKAYGLIRRLQARSKFALTGTPMENNLMELWSIFSITAPGLFPSPEKFKELFQRPIEKHNDPKALAALRTQIRPFLLRRLKETVEKELPPKTEQPWILEMSPRQDHVYQVHLQKERQKVLGLLDQGGLKANRFKILTSLMRLRQLCLHASLVDKKYARVPSAKLDVLTEHLETILAENHRVIIFSQFTSFLALVKKRLEKKKWKYAYLDGATTRRKEVLEDFRKDTTVPIFLISLKAGGVGLNLTSADYCILLDPWWNPAVEAQAVDRTHRIGQTQHVMVYRLIMRGTIEEKVVKLQDKKRLLFKNVLDEGDVFSNLVTEADIRGIFD
jgi:superfamily II DNA or RNA helicase